MLTKDQEIEQHIQRALRLGKALLSEHFKKLRTLDTSTPDAGSIKIADTSYLDRIPK